MQAGGESPRNSCVGVRRGRWTSQGGKLIGLDRRQQLSGPSHLPIAFLTNLCSARNLPFLLCPVPAPRKRPSELSAHVNPPELGAEVPASARLALL